MEKLKPGSSPDPQQDLIGRYCSEARQLLEHAASREEALAIRQRVCAQFARECVSPLVLDATESYVNQMIHTMWENPVSEKKP